MDVPVIPEGEMLGCSQGTCTLVVVSQTLDDRIELLSPDDPEGVVYRGSIDLDLKPNECSGCGLGDNGGDRLDEPFGVAVAGGHLHVVAGHYPTPERGTLLSFPFEFFAERAAGDRVDASAFFNGGTFSGVTAVPLERLEPIFVTAVEDKLVVAVFANNLFSAEDAWTQPGELLVLDAADPAGGVGVVPLDALDGGPCNGAARMIALGPGQLAVACDGNEAVAWLEHGALTGLSPGEAAATFSGALCEIPGSVSNRRVRYLAPDTTGGLVVAEGPTPLDVLGPGRLWRFAAGCVVRGVTNLPGDDWQLAQIAALPGRDAWVFASGAISASGNRGVFVAVERGDASELEICGPLADIQAHLVDDGGEPLEPFAIAVAPDGEHLAIGVGPFIPPTSGPGFGRILWAELQGIDDPCTMTASVTDLGAGPPLAPAVDPADPATYRRAPNVIELVEVSG